MENAGDFLTLKAPITTAADDFFFHVKTLFIWKIKKKKYDKIWMSSATNFAWYFKG